MWTEERLQRILLYLGGAILLLGYIATVSIFVDRIYEYSLLTVTAAASIILLLRVRGRSAGDAATLIMVAMFVLAYFLKYFWISYLVSIGDFGSLRELFGLREAAILSEDVLIDSFRTTVMSFLGVAVGATILNYCKRGGPSRTWRYGEDAMGRNLRTNRSVLITLPLVLSVGTAILQIAFLDYLGGQTGGLPFRLAGVLWQTREMLVPSFILLAVWAGDRTGDTRAVVWGVVLLTMHGVTSALITSSRGALFSPVFLILMLWLVCNRFSSSRVMWVVGLSPLAAVALPLFGIYRSVGAGEVPFVAASLFGAIEYTFTDASSVLESMGTGYLSLLTRFNGVDSLARIVNFGPADNAGWLWLLKPSGQSVSGLYTEEIMGFVNPWRVGFSPSLLGYFYFGTGTSLGTAVLTTGWYMGCWLLLRLVGGGRLLSGPVAVSVACVAVLQLSSEGTLERIPIMLPVFVVVAALTEWLARALLSPAGGASLERKGSGDLR